ncbi:MAG: SPOR domain-containing protein [Desulfobacterales bacterium]
MTTTEDKNQEKSKNSKKSGAIKKRGLPFWAVFFISAWMFFIGVMVGRGTSPVNFDIHELEKQIAELKKSTMKSEESETVGADLSFPETRSDLEFYEELETPEKDAPIPVIESKSKTVVKHRKLTDSQKKELKTSISNPEPEKPVEKLAATSDKNYSIQIASLKDPIDAIKLVEMLKKKGYPAYRTSAEIRGSGTWHRVRIGPFKSQSEALRIMGAVSQENKGAMILQHDP